MILRSYQQAAIVGFRSKAVPTVIVAPTGSGKTVIAAEIIRTFPGRVLFLAHRKELIDQASQKLTQFGVSHGIIMAGYPATEAQVQVASVQTLARRKIPPTDLVIADECHHVASATWRKILAELPNAKILGLTATPFRTDGAGLGAVFRDFIRVSTIEELTAMGWLVPVRYFAPPAADITGVRKVAGDYDAQASAAIFDRPGLVGDVVETYRRVAFGKRAICFAINVEHSKHLTAAFCRSLIPAEHLDGETPRDNRRAILRDLAEGNILVVCNCGILSEGYDNAAVVVCIQARPTMSACLHLQQIGRVLRPYPGKENAIVIDHAGNIGRHGLATANHPVDLTNGIKKEAQKGPAIKTCMKCYAVLPSTAVTCPVCGNILTAAPKKITVRRGELKEIFVEGCDCGSREASRVSSEKGVALACDGCGKILQWLTGNKTPKEYLREKTAIADARGYKPGWVAMLFKSRFGRWPTKADYA